MAITIDFSKEDAKQLRKIRSNKRNNQNRV